MSQPTRTTKAPLVTPPYPPLYTPFKYVSLRLAPALRDTRLSSNVLTVLWAVLLTAASVAMAYERTVVALALVLAAILLDCLDGDLARCRRQPSLAGTLLEQLAHWIGNMGLMAGAGAAVLLADPRPGNVLLVMALTVVQAIYIAVVRQVGPDAADLVEHPRLRSAFRRIVKGLWSISPIELPLVAALAVVGVTQGAVLTIAVLLAVLSALVFVPHFLLVRASDRSRWQKAARPRPDVFTNLPLKTRTVFLDLFPDARWWTPGVPALPPEVLALLGRQAPASGAPILASAWQGVTRQLPELFRTKGRVLPFAVPDDVAWEAVLGTLCGPGDEILVVGGRTAVHRRRAVAERLGVKAVCQQVPFGTGLARSELEAALARCAAPRAVLLSQAEAEDGTLTDLAAAAEVMRGRPPLVVIDACLGLCADDLRMDEWGIDIAVSSSQSGVMSPPGLSLIALGPHALDVLDEPAARPASTGTYLDLRTHLVAGGHPHARPPAPALAGLHLSVQMILTAGLDTVLAHHRRVAERFRRGCCDEVGLELVAAHPTAACTTALLPHGVDLAELQNRLFATRRMVVGSGTTPHDAVTLHFGHVGWLSDDDVDQAVGALADAVRAARS